MANNLFSRGINTGLNFTNLSDIGEKVAELTGMPIYYRQPYVGEYVFTAFSGSHQDAIRKGINKIGESGEKFGMEWKVPYLHIDPSDVGRKFERLIRINSQSGKGGVAYILEQEYGIRIPKQMQPELGAAMQRFSDKVSREVTSAEVYSVFQEEFINPNGPYELLGYWPNPDKKDPTIIHGELKIKVRGKEEIIQADGNGPISSFVAAIHKIGENNFTIEDYDEEAIGKGAEAKAIAYVPLKLASGEIIYGVGIDTNIDQAAVQAIVAGLNRKEKKS